MERNDKRTESILKGAVIGLLCLVLLVCGLLCFTWQLSVPEQGSVRQQETSAPPLETPAATDSEPAADVPAEEPEALETEVPTTPVKNDAGTSDKKPVVQKPNKEQTKETEPTLPEATKPAAPAQTEPVQPEETEAPVEETEPPIEENKALQASGQVNAENNVVMEDTSFSDNGVSAQVPAGTLLEKNTTELVLTITEKDSSDSGVALEAGQAMRPLDVHMEGISQANTQPIQVCLGKVLPNGMNIGNVTLYHVENGTANAMTQVLTMTDLDAHNEFYYDPATGDTTVAMASFSEVAVVAETAQPWEGKYDYTWYSADATELTIANADQLVAFGRIVSGYEVPAEVELPADGYDSFNGKIVKLTADVNLADKESENNENLIFYPIGYYYIADQNGDGNPYSTVYSFEGTFDGQGHTVANFYQNTWEMKGDDPYYDLSTNHYYNDAMGLFGYVVNGTVKNLTVDNFSSDGEFTPTGVIAAYAVNSEFENIAITNCNPRVYNTGNGGIVGIGGNSDDAEDSKLTFTNITIDNTNKISALWGSWDVACGGLVGMFRGAGHVYMTNCHVAAQIDVYNDVCGNYQYYWYRYSGMLVGTNKNMATDENGYTVPETEKFHAENCTVHFGEWNDYYYCELVANSLASYTHDHQFSRLEQISSLDEIKSGDTWTKTGNFLLIDGDTKTCYHIVKAEDGTMKQHLHTDAGAETSVDVNGDGVIDENDLKEDKQIVYLPFNQLFTGYGWGVKHIPVYNGEDYAFDGVAVLDREVGADSVQKFASTGMTEVTEDETITIGTLFSAVTAYEDEIVPKAIQIAVTDLDETGVTAEFTRNDENWAAGTLTFTGTGRLKVTIQDYYFCTPTSITLTVNEPANVDKFDLVFENTDDYLYRVGNANKVALGSLFKAIDGAKIGNVTATVTSLDENISVSGTYTANTTDWTQGTIQFSGTGLVLVTIDDDKYANEKTLMLEVVNATNVTDYSGLGNKNSVLLKDITMTSGGYYYLSNATLYGNGFIFDVTDGAYSGTGSISNNYVICLSNAALDNVEIQGAVYTAYGAQVANDYNRPTVLSVGNNTITNCYISNCAAPVRVRDGNLEIINSTLKGGNFANLDIRNGHVVLDNVTTINQVNGNDTAEDGTVVVGLGVVVYYENVLNTTTVEVKNGITQYNHLSKTQANTYITDTTAKQLTAKMFESAYSAVQYNDGSDTWVNTGILSMTETVGDANISDIDGYVEASPSMTGVTGYLHTKQPDATSIATTAPAYATAGQGAIAPSYSFDYTTKNYVAKVDGSNDYCYEDGGTVLISMDEGDSFNWDTSILTATKNGQTLDYTVSMDGTDYTGKSIAFNTAGDYTVKYTYTDANNYSVDASGNITTYKEPYEKTVHISVAVVAPNAKNAEFTFGSSNTASTTVTVGNNTYVMPNVTATSSTIGSTTISGTTIYYPIVEIVMSDGKTSHTSAWYAYFPVFSGAVTITDYADSGTGDAITYGMSTTTMPNGLSVNGDPSSLFKYQSSSSAGADPVVKNSILVYSSPSISAKRDEYNTVITYIYQDNVGATYYYCIGYHAAAQTYSSTCITADTLITLANGNHIRVDALTGDEQLLVWNHTTGSFDTAPVAYIVDHNSEVYQQEIYHLYFSDGSDIRIIGEHVFFDATLNKYVTLDENAADYIGHTFVGISDGNDALTSIQLTDVVTEYEETAIYEVVSYEHLTCFTDGILSASAYMDKLLNIFDIDPETMAYTPEKVQSDIETYGLYTYADFEGLIEEEAFELYNAKYLKIAVGKGYITWDDILDLIDIYFNVGVTPLQ